MLTGHTCWFCPKTMPIAKLPMVFCWMKYHERRLVLLIDFDNDVPARQDYVRRHIPESMQHRVYVLGVCSEPEQLRTACNKKFEAIGEALADECAQSR